MVMENTLFVIIYLYFELLVDFKIVVRDVRKCRILPGMLAVVLSLYESRQQHALLQINSTFHLLQLFSPVTAWSLTVYT